MNKQYVIFNVSRLIALSVLVATALSGCGGGGGGSNSGSGSGACSIDCSFTDPFTFQTEISVQTFNSTSEECAVKGSEARGALGNSCIAAYNGEQIFPTTSSNTTDAYQECRSKCSKKQGLFFYASCTDSCDKQFNIQFVKLAKSYQSLNSWTLTSSNKDQESQSVTTEKLVLSNTFIEMANIDGKLIQFRTTLIIDIDSDGYLDIVALDDGPGNILLFINNADATYRKIEFPIAQGVSSFAMADLNRDTILDLCVLNSDLQFISILLGDGLGFFYENVVYQLNSGYSSVSINDSNYDGYVDIHLTNTDPMKYLVMYGSGEGGFSVSTQ